MADLLSGSNAQTDFAPLSQAQTIAICRHLQQEIRNVEGGSDDLRRETQLAKDYIETLRDKLAQTQDDLQKVQSIMSNGNLGLTKLQSDVDRNTRAMQQLQSNDQAGKDRIAHLEEGQKMIETRLDVLSTDFYHQRDLMKRLQDDITNRLDQDIRALFKKLESNDLAMDQFRKEHELFSASQKEDRESLRQAHLSVESVFNEVKKTNTVASILENRLASIAKGVQQTWAKKNELAEASVRLSENLEKQRSRLDDFEAQVKTLSDAQTSFLGELEDGIRQVGRNTDRLSQALKLLDEETSSSNEMRHQISSLRQSIEQANRSISSLQRDVKVVSQTAQEVRAGLKDQSAILLPNIHLQDSQEVQSTAARHGSLLFGSTTSTLGSTRSRGGGGGGGGTPRSAKLDSLKWT